MTTLTDHMLTAATLLVGAAITIDEVLITHPSQECWIFTGTYGKAKLSRDAHAWRLRDDAERTVGMARHLCPALSLALCEVTTP
jgi:hypothetical protein